MFVYYVYFHLIWFLLHSYNIKKLINHYLNHWPFVIVVLEVLLSLVLLLHVFSRGDVWIFSFCNHQGETRDGTTECCVLFFCIQHSCVCFFIHGFGLQGGRGGAWIDNRTNHRIRSSPDEFNKCKIDMTFIDKHITVEWTWTIKSNTQNDIGAALAIFVPWQWVAFVAGIQNKVAQKNGTQIRPVKCSWKRLSFQCKMFSPILLLSAWESSCTRQAKEAVLQGQLIPIVHAELLLSVWYVNLIGYLDCTMRFGECRWVQHWPKLQDCRAEHIKLATAVFPGVQQGWKIWT